MRKKRKKKKKKEKEERENGIHVAEENKMRERRYKGRKGIGGKGRNIEEENEKK